MVGRLDGKNPPQDGHPRDDGQRQLHQPQLKHDQAQECDQQQHQQYLYVHLCALFAFWGCGALGPVVAGRV